MRLKFTATLLLLLAATQSAIAQSPLSPAELTARRALAQDLNTTTQVREGIGSWKEMLLAQDPSTCGCGVPAEMAAKIKDAWRDAVEKSFDAKSIESELTEAMANTLSKEALMSELAFSRSNLGRKLTAAMVATRKNRNLDRTPQEHTADWAKAFASASKKLDKNPKRAALLNEWITATDSLNGQVDVIMAFSKGSAIGSLAAQPSDTPRPSQDQLDTLLETQRQTLEKTMIQILPASFEMIYGSLTDRDLKLLVAHLKTPLSAAVNRAQDAALIASAEAAAQKIGITFAKNYHAHDI